MVHFVGIGPGDPALVTVRVASLLREADIVLVPQSNYEGRSVAESIITPYAKKEAIQYIVVPMTRDRAIIEGVYATIAETIAAHVAAGRRVVCVTIGDSMLYSTAGHIGERLLARGIQHSYLSGIPSFVEAANRLGLCLAAGGERSLTTPMPETVEETAALAKAHDSVVFLKINKRLPVLVAFVREYSPAVAMLAYRVGLADERFIDLKAGPDIPEGIGYLSLAIVRQG